MVKDSVLISGGINLGASPSANPEGNVMTVTVGGKTIEPVLVFGTDLGSNCRGILVPYGAEVTLKVTNNYNLNIRVNSSDIIIRYVAGSTNKFLAVRDIYIDDIAISAQSDAPT